MIKHLRRGHFRNRGGAQVWVEPTMCGEKKMSDTKSMDRVIRILDDELTLLMDSGLYREAEKTRKRLEIYMDMRNKAKVALAKLRGESVQDD